MKVLYICHVGNLAGAARSLLELLSSFPKGKIDPYVISPKGRFVLPGICPCFMPPRGSGSLPKKRPCDLASTTCTSLVSIFLKISTLFFTSCILKSGQSFL